MVNIVKESSGNSIVAKLLAYCILLNFSFVPLQLAIIPSHAVKHQFLRNAKTDSLMCSTSYVPFVCLSIGTKLSELALPIATTVDKIIPALSLVHSF